MRVRKVTLRSGADRYLDIYEWASRRYGFATRIGGAATRLTRIEGMAAVAYLGARERHTGMALRDCPTVNTNTKGI